MMAYGFNVVAIRICQECAEVILMVNRTWSGCAEILATGQEACSVESRNALSILGGEGNMTWSVRFAGLGYPKDRPSRWSERAGTTSW